MTAKEAAIDLIRTEVERGDDEASIRRSWMGRCGGGYTASVGGYIFPPEYLNGEKEILQCPKELIKKVGSDKIIVEEFEGRVVNRIFSLKEIYSIIKEKSGFQLSIFDHEND